MHSGESLLADLQPTDDSTPFKNKDIQQKNVACLLSVCHCLFSYYSRQYLLKMGGQLDKRMLHWQVATHHMLYFQLFIIVRYLANKVLLCIHQKGRIKDTKQI